jgi:hypothetical protein
MRDWGMGRGLAMLMLVVLASAPIFASEPMAPVWLLRNPMYQPKSKELPAPTSAAPLMPIYRTPYAYGYFGATPSRHWRQHFGVQRQYTQWTLR